MSEKPGVYIEKDTGDPPEISAIKKVLHQALAERQPRDYSAVFLMTLYFETDDTGAAADCESIVKSFDRNVSTNEVFRVMIPASIRMPYRFMQGKIFGCLNSICNFYEEKGFPMKSLIIFHYAGHGQKSPDLSLVLRSGEQELKFSSIKEALCGQEDASMGAALARTDIVFLLDCCYSACASRATGDKLVEVLASGVERTNIRTPRNKGGLTFSQSIAGELNRNRRSKLSIVDLQALLMKRRITPVHSFLLGEASIQLPPSPVTPTDVEPALGIAPSLSAPSNQVDVLLKIHLDSDPGSPEVNETCQILRSFPKEARITIEKIFPSTSTIIIITCSLDIGVQFDRYDFIMFLGPIIGE